MTFVLPNGFVLNTADPNANEIFRNEQPRIANGLLELKQRILNSTAIQKGETLAERVRRRYQMKNTNGYLLNAFLDFDTPLDILTHIMIGSEGTLGFICRSRTSYPARLSTPLYWSTLFQEHSRRRSCHCAAQRA